LFQANAFFTQDGIFMELSKIMGNSEYNKCTIQIFEFEHNNLDPKPNSTRESKGNPDGTDDGTVANDSSEDDTDDDSRLYSGGNVPFTFNFDKGRWTGQGREMADVIVPYLDDPTKRRIWPTTNNPVSSRSHVIMHIKYEGSSGLSPAELIICDFAGVENKFDCNSKAVIDKFKAFKEYGSIDTNANTSYDKYETAEKEKILDKKKQLITEFKTQLEDLISDDTADTILNKNIVDQDNKKIVKEKLTEIIEDKFGDIDKLSNDFEDNGYLANILDVLTYDPNAQGSTGKFQFVRQNIDEFNKARAFIQEIGRAHV
jgi:hypothetical protein